METEKKKNEANSESAVRPLLVVDKTTVRNYGPCLRRIFVGLGEEGCHCGLVCPDDCDTSDVESPSVEILRLPTVHLPFLKFHGYRVLANQVRNFHPTILHSFSETQANLTRSLAEQFSLPYVLSFHAYAGKMPHPSVSHSLCRGLIASNSVVRGRLEDVYPRMRDRIYQVNIGTFVEERPTCFARSDYVPSLIGVAKLEKIQELAPLLQALRHLAIDGYDFVMIIIGNGVNERKLYKLRNSLGLARRITVVDRIRPLRKVFSDADIYVQAQPRVGLTYPLLEAMSVGMAVAACRGTEDEMLEENETAVFFDDDDELTIYSTLKKLLSQKDFAARIAKSGQNRVRLYHRVSQMAEGLYKTYRICQNVGIEKAVPPSV